MSIAIKKMCQIGGFLGLVCMLFLALSVGSYSRTDPNWNRYVSHQEEGVHNLGGIVGASVADWGLQMLGSTVFLLIGMGSIGAWCVMRRRLRTAVAIAWRACLLCIAVSGGSHLMLTTDPIFGTDIIVGGVLGLWFAELLVRYVNPVGAFLVISTAGILALFVGVNHQSLFQTLGRRCGLVTQYGWRAGRHIWRGGLALGHAGRWIWRYVITAARFGSHGIRRLLGGGGGCPPPVLEDASPCFSPPARDEPDVSAPQEVATEKAQRLPGPVPKPLAQEADAAARREAAVPPRPLWPQGSRRQRPRSLVPSLDLLDHSLSAQRARPADNLQAEARFLEQKLRDFGVEGEVVQVLPGPVITMYEFAPAPGVKVSKIVNLQDDLALVMRALSVRIVAPIPGKAVVGIEIPNKHREIVRLRDLLDSEEFRSSTSTLSVALGKDILGKPVITDLALIPHLLIAGATGSGKSVGLNSMICSLLFRAMPTDVKMIMIDPKMLELSVYDGIAHLLIPVVTNPKQAAVALRRVVEEMERRYQLLAAKGVRSIAQYNQLIAEQHAAVSLQSETRHDEACEGKKLPYLVVIIDELSDLMMVSSREVEDSLTRIAQMARAAGIHLIVATQRPSVDVLTGVIKANFPARVSFQVSSKTDSRTILDTNGAERLLGRGDMLFLAPGTSKPQRLHGAYVSEAEINRLVMAWKALEQPHYDDSFLEPAGKTVEPAAEEYDEKYDAAVALVARTRQASISMLQRRLRVGYNRAARMIEVMEKEGIIGPAEGVKPREVLVRKDFDAV